jgi:hypothetical protein
MALRPRYLRIAEHGPIGELHTVALVGTDGTIDWYCCPRFDSCAWRRVTAVSVARRTWDPAIMRSVQ